MKHTPGPWALEPKNGVITHANGVICDLRYPIYPANQPDELSANARLIAAAPELLFSVKCLLDLIQHPDAHWRKAEVIAEAEKNIRKAEGKQASDNERTEGK